MSKTKTKAFLYQRMDKAAPHLGWEDITLAEMYYKVGMCYDNHVDVVADAITNGTEVQTPWAIYRVVKVEEVKK